MTVEAPRKHDRTFTSVGVDGCKGGWFFVKVDPRGAFSWGVVGSLEELVLTASDGDRIFVDIPIGLPDRPGERPCDKLARKRLGTPRGSSVFPAPARETLEATDDFERAKRINRQVLDKAISKQTFAICPKIKEADDLLRRSRKARSLVYEVHPELCFWALAGQAMRHNKKSSEGYEERLAVLGVLSPGAERAVRSASGLRSGEFARDDVVDAAVAALTATASEFRSLPDEPPIDSCSLPMRMVYADKTAIDRATGRGRLVDRVPRSPLSANVRDTAGLPLNSGGQTLAGRIDGKTRSETLSRESEPTGSPPVAGSAHLVVFDAAELRGLLIGTARCGGLLTYGEVVRSLLGESWSAQAGTALFKALDSVGAENQRRGEPLLPALVVSRKTGVPGPGFFTKWLPGAKDDPSRRDAHEECLAAVRRRWS